MSKSGKHGGGYFGTDGVAHNSAAFAKRYKRGRAASKAARMQRKKTGRNK